MKHLNTTVATMLLGLGLCEPLSGAPPKLPNPDFTKGEKIPEGATQDWTLGATGARGWMHTYRLATREARQVAITEVAEGSPARGVLEVGDVLLGVAGEPFSHDPRQEIGRALTAAEAGDGKLVLTRWRAGKTAEVAVMLPVLGIPSLEKAIAYFEKGEPDFPQKLSLQKAEMVRKAIGEIRGLTAKPEPLKLNL